MALPLLDAGPVSCSAGRTQCLPIEIEHVLDAKCWACHGEPVAQNVPMPLRTVQDFEGSHLGSGRANFERMVIRIQDEHMPMPPITYPQLTAMERQTLIDWAADGLPSGP